MQIFEITHHIVAVALLKEVGLAALQQKRARQSRMRDVFVARNSDANHLVSSNDMLDFGYELINCVWLCERTLHGWGLLAQGPHVSHQIKCSA
jgi:hypothetical protein